MNCSKANEYFMKYMDNCLSEEEARLLHKHLASCSECAEDFKVYDSIMSEFAVTELLEAPADLEERVMAAIDSMPPVWEKVNSKQDKVLWLILGAFTALLSLGFGLFINREAILSYMSGYPELEGYVQMLTPVSNYVTEFTANISQIVVDAAVWASTFVGTYKFIILGAAVLLFGAQFVLYKREKVED